jgi:hypothetical protein
MAATPRLTAAETGALGTRAPREQCLQAREREHETMLLSGQSFDLTMYSFLHTIHVRMQF